GIAAAKARGWQVLVTAHHLAGPQLPSADAIVDPNRPGDAFPSKALAGVGVMFYLLLALRARLFADEPDRRPDLSVLLDLVAVGTVADLVPLDANNRALVAAGLRRLRAGRGCAGLRALIEVAGRDEATLTATDIGYALAPRINAAGRLDDMGVGIECLLSDDQAMRARSPPPCTRSTPSARACSRRWCPKPSGRCRCWRSMARCRQCHACSIRAGMRAWSGWSLRD